MWTEDGEDNTFFNDIYFSPMIVGGPPKTLVVTFNSGPHGVATTEYSEFDHMAMKLGLARLKINPRGSRGMGDEVLQAIVGNVGEVSDANNTGLGVSSRT